MNVNTNGNTVFEWFVNITTITGPTKHPSNLTPATSVSFSSASSFCSTDSKCSCLVYGTSIISSPLISACPSSWCSIYSGKSSSAPSLYVSKIWISRRVAENWTKVSRVANMYIMEFSDRIYTVETEETAKYVEPKGILAKTWDWLSEYHSCSPPKTYAHHVFLSVNCYDVTTCLFLWAHGRANYSNSKATIS